MSEKKGSTTSIAVSPNKLALSRALGAAFLSHQVEQLEKSVVGEKGVVSASPVGNWRNRRPTPPALNGRVAGHHSPASAKRPPMAPGIKVANKGGNAKEDSQAARKARAATGAAAPATTVNGSGREPHVNLKSHPPSGRRSGDTEREEKEKDVDIIVVDASVLVNALYQVKKWCRDGRREIIIVPLEALNTLDLLKKGTSSVAQRARAASRILEAQVGSNHRIRVQQDDAFVPWENILFNESSEAPDLNFKLNGCLSPEWVRRTICCAKWEIENAAATLRHSLEGGHVNQTTKQPKVVLAVLSSATDVSPRMQALKISESPPECQSLLLNPVPLPAPQTHCASGGNKFEPRSNGFLIAHWAAKAGIQLLEVDPTRHGVGAMSEDEGRGKRLPSGKCRRGSYTEGSVPHVGTVGVMGTGLVERPPAVRAMMEKVAQQPTAIRVVRVLARGEKLDPDS